MRFNPFRADLVIVITIMGNTMVIQIKLFQSFQDDYSTPKLEFLISMAL